MLIICMLLIAVIGIVLLAAPQLVAKKSLLESKHGFLIARITGVVFIIAAIVAIVLLQDMRTYY